MREDYVFPISVRSLYNLFQRSLKGSTADQISVSAEAYYEYQCICYSVEQVVVH